MEQITLGQISAIILFLGSLIGGIGYLINQFKKWLKSTFKEELEPIKKDISTIKTDIKEVDMNSTKNYLSKCFNDLRQGQELSEANKQRIYEQMEHYTKMGGNSYIHKEFEDLKKEGLL